MERVRAVVGLYQARPSNFNEEMTSMQTIDPLGFGQVQHLPFCKNVAWQAELAKLAYPEDTRSQPEFLQRSRALAGRILTPEINAAIARFREPAGPPAIVIRGLPVGNLPGTPADGLRPLGKDGVSEGVLLGILEQIGNAISYRNEKHGELVQQVVPLEGETRTNTNTARAEFGHHTDNAFIPPHLRQQIIGLLGLRNPSRAATTLLPLQMLLAAMPDRLTAALHEPLVRFPASKSFDFLGWELLSPPRPVLYEDADGVTRLNGNVYATNAVNEASGQVLREFFEVIRSLNPLQIVLDAGDCLIFRDDSAMHGRVAFEGDRWIQRAYARFELEAVRQVQPVGRVFEVSDLLFG
jgi:L-asparagine oxygenase